MEYIHFSPDPDQLGGMKGSSISHYLIEVTNFILYKQDLKKPQATLAIFIDYKQGFNRCQHSIFIELMSVDYKLLGWLIKIIIGYLTKQKLCIKYKSKLSHQWDIHGGTGEQTGALVPFRMWDQNTTVSRRAAHSHFDWHWYWYW